MLIEWQEWDFSEVPDDELQSCRDYEYLRESTSLCRDVALLNRLFSSSKAKKPPQTEMDDINKVEIVGRIELLVAVSALLAHVSDFPRVPWQKLAPADKKYLQRLIGTAKMLQKRSQASVIESFTIGSSLGKKSLEQWAMEREAEEPGRECLYCVTASDPRSSNEHLAEDYKRHLDKIHPEGIGKAAKKVGRQNADRDALNALGALRLRWTGMSWPKAYRTMTARMNLLPPEKKRKATYYSDRTSSVVPALQR